MRYRYLLVLTGCLCASVAAQVVTPPPSSGYLRKPVPAPASTAPVGYRDTLSTAAKDAERFNFSEGPMKDKAPADQTPTRVIINNGRGAHVNCVPMGPGGACH